MAHCCQNCTGECNGEISDVLKNGRKVYFCSGKCHRAWMQSKIKNHKGALK